MLEMLRYYIQRLAFRMACWVIPSKNTRHRLREKMGFGREIVPLSQVDTYVPKAVLDSIHARSPLDFLPSYKVRLQPMPLDALRTAMREKVSMPPPR